MKKWIITSFILLLHCTARADYGYMSLSELVCIADYAATGTIVRLDQNYFYFKVERYILNKLEQDTLKIQRFESWSCGKRHAAYTTGQKELIFFRKSNYVIDDYELLGYGGGGEFELPILKDSIFYHSSYGTLQPFVLNDFLRALKDFDQVRQRTKETSIPISKEAQALFAAKSALHQLFIECKPYRKEVTFDIPAEGYMINLESNFLYQDYENKVLIPNLHQDSIFLSIEDAGVWRQDQYFVVKPKDGWTRRWLNVYAAHDTGRTRVLFSQLFEVIELPEPRIYFGMYYSDSLYTRRRSMPTVACYLDDMHTNEYLQYKLLSYTYEIHSGDQTESYLVKSESGTHQLRERAKRLKTGDQVSIKNAFVLYPNGTVKKIKERTLYVGRSD
ncbi:MAG: hypothetical protein JNL13_07775 [Chitinophagaceae bacterium]|nr:hypothetical protein [Chitinophagaceae bacterium]